MSQVEFDLSSNQREAIVESVTTLRRIRNYMSPHYLTYREDTPDLELAFTHAQAIQEALSGYLVAGILWGKTEILRNEWEETVAAANEIYREQDYELGSNNNSDPKGETVKVIHSILKLFSQKDYRGLQAYLLEPNGLNIEVEELAEQLLVVVAPLSTDYLAAGVLRECVRKKFSDLYGNPFTLYPAVFNDGLEEVILPKLLQDPQFYENQAGVMVLTDNPSTGKTLHGVCRAVRDVCEDHSKIINVL